MNAQDPLPGAAVEHIPQSLPGNSVPWLREARQAALDRFSAHGLPTTRDEEWKYTDTALIRKRVALMPQITQAGHGTEEALRELALPQMHAHRMVFVNGRFESELSLLGALPDGVRLESLAQALDDGSQALQPFFAAASEHTPFSSLNTAYTADGAVLHLAPGAIVEAPIYLLFYATGTAGAIYPRNLIMAGKGSRATLIEHYAGSADARNFTDAVTQISIADGAAIEHYKLLQEGDEALHVAGIHATQGADSRFDSHSFALGGRLLRNDITTRLEEPGGQCSFNGLYLVGGKQHVDHHTRIDHLAPGCTSREHYRGVLDGSARGVFNGKVIVHVDAQKTDAHQDNYNLLLSRQAEMDTKPQLEIFADDVKCTHGATVGQLDDDMVFYLRTRGIDTDLGRALLVYGFANNVIALVKLPALREALEHILLTRLPQGDTIKEIL